MYLTRKIDSYLTHWKQTPDHKPLLVKGARQVGKSESIRHFGEQYYENIVEINFVSQPIYKTITQDGYEADKIIKSISLINPYAVFKPGKTLIFIDEIQDYPEIATALKFFKIDGRFDVICSGSMLGVNYHRIHSVSVGYKTDYDMYSMDFEEFLWAKGYKQDLIDDMYQHIIDSKPFSQTEYEMFMSLFRDYCVLGGMPEIIASYISKGTFENVLSMQRQLMLDYKDDVRKYVEGLDQLRILNVLNRVPVQLGADNKKFQISKVAKGAKTRDYWGCVEWLLDAGIINICYCLNFPELPLKGNYDASKYKLYFADTGLLIASLDDESQNDLRANSNLGTYKGAIYENAIAEALHKAGADLFYYKRDDSTLEEDFFLRTSSDLVPVEVKSGNAKSQSLTTLIKSDKYPDIRWGIKLAAANIGCSDAKILTIPYFCAFLLKRYMIQQTSMPD